MSNFLTTVRDWGIEFWWHSPSSNLDHFRCRIDCRIGRKRDFSNWNIALIEIAIAWNYSNHEIQWIFTFSIYRLSRYLHAPAAPNEFDSKSDFL